MSSSNSTVCSYCSCSSCGKVRKVCKKRSTRQNYEVAHRQVSQRGSVISEEARSLQKFNESSLLGVSASVLDHPTEKGTIFNVSSAFNHAGFHKGSTCVLKWPRSSHKRVCDVDHVSLSVSVADMSAEILHAFKSVVSFGDVSIMINRPKVVTCSGGAHCRPDAVRAIAEPHLGKRRRFNSVDGWGYDSVKLYNQLLQALCHFSLVWSQGKFVLCGLKGELSKDYRRVTITDPTLISKNAGTFGCRDSGVEGMRQFMSGHVCNDVCKKFERAMEKQRERELKRERAREQVMYQTVPSDRWWASQ